jgi:hypothetical protein
MKAVTVVTLWAIICHPIAALCISQVDMGLIDSGVESLVSITRHYS